jgi:hypothetical protein
MTGAKKISWSLVDDLKEFDLGNSGASVAEWREIRALHLNESGIAVFLNNDINFKSFRLEAEVAIPKEGFIGLVFGARDIDNYELIYLSHGDSKGVGEIQYDPVMNGSTTWQIYHGTSYQAFAPYILGEWVRFSVEIQQNSARVYVGEATDPQLIISNLQHGLVSGKIGVWGYSPTYIRNLSIEEIQAIESTTTHTYMEQLKAESFVTKWMVSKPYYDNTQLIETDWIREMVEENGTLNINRLYTSSKDISVQAKSTLYISEEIESVITFGFSDRLRLWINEEEIYQGVWKWSPPESDGRIRWNFISVPIRWRFGLNTILAEITNQEVIFGWGFCLKTGLTNIDFTSDEV